MDYAVIDIESVPCQWLPAVCRPEFDQASVKLGNTKDVFKIREKIEEAKTAFYADLDKRMSVDPDLCQVVCVVGYHKGRDSFLQLSAVDEAEETELIMDAWGWIRERYQEKTPLVTFNGLSFDLPVLLRRAMFSDISVNPVMVANLMRRQEYNFCHYDLMQLLGKRNPFSGPTFNGLEYHLKRWGIGAKLGDGSMVYPWFKEGADGIEKILEYCRDGDVVGTAKLFERVAPWLVATKSITPISGSGKE